MSSSKRAARLFVGFGIVGADAWTNPRQAASASEHARPHAPRFVDRDSSRQHDPDSHRQERFRPEHHVHGLPADCRRRTERAVRGHHHCRDGRHRPHAGRQRRLRFSRQRNAEHPQSGSLHLSGPARSGVATARRSEERAFREGRHRFGRRQEHLLRRSGEGAAVEAHHPRERRPDQHHGIDGRRAIRP